MNLKLASLTIAISLVLGITTGFAQFQYDVFYSLNDVGDEPVNGDLVADLCVGETATLYMYFSTNGPNDTDLSVGCAVDVTTSQTGIISFDSAATLDFDIFVGEIEIAGRWLNAQGEGGGVGPASSVTPDEIINMMAFTVNGGQGILEANNGQGPFLDTGYDSHADAFLIGVVEFTAIGAGTVNLITVEGATGFVNGSNAFDPVFAGATVNVIDAVLLGDINLDGIVNLGDINPFVDLLASGGFQAEADINQDGLFNSSDIQPFIDLISGNEVLLGDINLDGIVSLDDVNPFVILLASGGFQAEADINQDGLFNSSDIQPFIDLLSDL